MLRRVTMREATRGTAIAPEAVDAAARADALAMAKGNIDARATDALEAALPGLPDMTADLPAR
jgi:hypothetical protein